MHTEIIIVKDIALLNWSETFIFSIFMSEFGVFSGYIVVAVAATMMGNLAAVDGWLQRIWWLFQLQRMPSCLW